MTRSPLALLATLCALSVFGQLNAQATDHQVRHSHPVIRVVDGDTVILSLDGAKTRVRLIGIDTPETVHPQKPVEYYGQEASTFVRNLLRGESVYVEYERAECVNANETSRMRFYCPSPLMSGLSCG